MGKKMADRDKPEVRVHHMNVGKELSEYTFSELLRELVRLESQIETAATKARKSKVCEEIDSRFKRVASVEDQSKAVPGNTKKPG